MKKIRIFFGVTAVYEAGKILITLVSRPAAAVLLLPFSWYAAIPLLLLPLLFLIFLAADPEKYSEYCFAAGLCKIMYMLSIVYYCLDVLSLSMNNLLEASVPSIFQFALFLLIFFLIDGILCGIIFAAGKKIKSVKLDSEGSICK